MGFIKYLFSKQFLKQLVIASVLLVVLFIGLKTWLKITTNHDQQIQVPDLSKLNVSEVALKLTELNLQYEVIDSSSFNPNFPKQSVIDQAPEKDAFVKENRTIYLTLNPSSYADVEIKEFYGKTKKEVIAELESVGFEIGEIYFIPDLGKNVVRKMKYNGKYIKAGTKIPKHSVIDLVLGNGKRR